MGIQPPRVGSSAVELTFELRDTDCFFVELSSVFDTKVSLERFVRRSDHRLLEYFTVDGVASEDVLSMVDQSEGVDTARVVGQGVGKRLFEFVVTGSCVTTTLADAGAIAQRISAEEGVGTVTAIVPEHKEVRAVAETFQEHHSPTELVARHETDRVAPVETEGGAQITLTHHLTDRQREVLRTAFRSGYFEWPRTGSAEDCARQLEISQPTFSQHLRVAQEKIFDVMFEKRNPRF